MTLFEIYADIDEQACSASIHIATFWDRDDAQAFVTTENDIIQADLLSIWERPMIDNYGFPCLPYAL